ncbi:MAG: FecR family protein [Patescibacteria group bacterium]|nr:FecR family protein [Patescibacteria group bacterium]
MLEFYEKKGHKIFILVMIGLIVVTTFMVIFGEFVAFNRDMARMDVIVEQTNKMVTQNVQKQKVSYDGQIEYIEGDVEKRSGTDGGWFTAEKSDIIKSGDEVRTLAGARAIVTFEDGSAVRLDENTQILFDSQNENITVGMEKGFVYNKVAKSDARVYIVKTGDYEVKALGTEFSVENENASVEVMVIESAVDVEDINSNKTQKIEEGNKASVTGDTITEEKITQKDLEDDFIVWNTQTENKDVVKEKEKDEKNNPPSQEVTSDKGGSIILSGEKSSSGVRLHWNTNGVNTSHGFKVVKSKESNPVYPGNDYKYLSDSGVRDYKWKIDTGKKYHFRVCAYQGNGKCGVYSNDVYVDTPSGDSDEKKDDDKSDGDYASKVSLSASKDGDNVKLKWDISGGDAPKGFKVVKSKDKNPVYPGDDYKYLSDDDTRKYTWKDLKEGKSYHFRVCIYKGGKCGTYSNDVKVSL